MKKMRKMIFRLWGGRAETKSVVPTKWFLKMIITSCYELNGAKIQRPRMLKYLY